MRAGIALISLAVLASGCTATMLDRNTVNQAMTVTDMRYQEVMDNLAVVAHNTGTLPSFALNGGGTPTVTNMVSVEPKTTWDPVGLMSQTLNMAGKHNPQVMWNFEPVVSNFQLAALRYACIWAVCGQEHVDADGLEYLRAPRRDDIFPSNVCDKGAVPPSNVIPHFDVMYRLGQLPPHWLKCGSRTDVHSCACYKAKCCGTYVWVDPPDLKALSDFTLVILDIATRDPASLAFLKPTAQVVVCNTLENKPSDLSDLPPLCKNSNCSDCKCSFDPIPPHNAAAPSEPPQWVHDCSMNIKCCPTGTDAKANMQVTETWNVYQGDSGICQKVDFGCERPQISCKDYIVYSGAFVTNLPYVCKARPSGKPCAAVKPPPPASGRFPNALLEQNAYQLENPPESYVVPQFEPPAAYGTHAPPPYPSR